MSTENANQTVMEMSDGELMAVYRAADARTQYGVAHYREEILRRSQDRHTSALHRWNIVIAVATLVNAVAVIVQVYFAINAK